jgi:hypothetical protein
MKAKYVYAIKRLVHQDEPQKAHELIQACKDSMSEPDWKLFAQIPEISLVLQDFELRSLYYE